MSQCSLVWKTGTIARPGQYSAVQAGRLNVVRSGRPEQCHGKALASLDKPKSQCSPAWKTGTIPGRMLSDALLRLVSM